MNHEEETFCPVCQEECQDYYVNYNGNEIVGCEHCIHVVFAPERAAEDRLGAEIDRRYDEYKERGYQ